MKYTVSLVATILVLEATLVASEAGQQAMRLTGAMGTPAVTTKACGRATLNVGASGAVSGGIQTAASDGPAISPPNRY